MNRILVFVALVLSCTIYSATTSQYGCTDDLDVLVVLDGSESIDGDRFTEIKSAMKMMVADLKIKTTPTRLGVILYSSAITTVIPLCSDDKKLLDAITSLQQPMEGTRTHLALEEMNKMFEREGRDGVPKVGIVITDGESKNKMATVEEATKSSDMNINMFAVNINMDGPADREELEAIASSDQHIIPVGHLSEICKDLKQLLKECSDSGVPDGQQTPKNDRELPVTPPGNPSGTKSTVNPSDKYRTTSRPGNGNRMTPSSPDGSGNKATPSSGGNGNNMTPPPNGNENNVTPPPNGSGNKVTPPADRKLPGYEVVDAMGMCDNCTMMNGVGYNAHKTSCEKYVQCMFELDMLIKAVVRECGPGLLWDQEKLTCNFPTEVECNKGPCSGKTDGDYKNEDNCRQYYTCKDGVTYDKCCLRGEGFDSRSQKCEASNSCQDTCRWGEPETECTRRAIPTDKRSYQQLLPEGDPITMSCAVGSVFNGDQCKCSEEDEEFDPSEERSLPKPRDCSPVLHLTFDEGTNDKSGHNNFVQNKGVRVEDGTAYFDGGSFLRVPRFSNVDFGKNLTIKLKYKLDGSASGNQALITNSDCGDEGSIYISADSSSTRFRLAVDGDQEMSTTGTSARTSDWNEVEYKVSEDMMMTSVNGETNNKMAEGIIIRRHCALQIGRGDGYDNFKGWMDEVTVSMC